MVVDPGGSFLTAREIPGLLLIEPAIEDGGLTLMARGRAPLRVPTPSATLVPVRVWSSELLAADGGDEAAAWMSAVLGRPARLVHLDDPERRRADPEFAGPDGRVSFADAFPLLLTTTASLVELNAWIADGPRADEGPLPMVRFRPNLVIDGTVAWQEDGWRRIRIGAAVFRVVKGCSRCVMTTTDADTAARGKEPIATLARYRRWEGKTWFGMNLVPDTSGATISVGDEVEILDAGSAPDGPPR
jgi:uncharacterized protein YcbX